MALTDQPYLPLYVDDWMNNNKLKLCTLSSRGLMIQIMCVMHKSENYGVVKLKAKFKQNESKIKNFASQLSKLCNCEYEETFAALSELVEENVLIIEEDEILSNRMVKDFSLSNIRKEAGRKGGINGRNTPTKALYNEAGYLYLLNDLSDTSIYKIGISKDPEKRLKQVIAKTGKESLTMVHYWTVSDMGVLEQLVLNEFEDIREGEWLKANINLTEILQKVSKVLAKEEAKLKAKQEANAVIETVIVNENVNGNKKEENGENSESGNLPALGIPLSEHFTVSAMIRIFQKSFPNYCFDSERDNQACQNIALKICHHFKIPPLSVNGGDMEPMKIKWGELCVFASADRWFSKKGIYFLNTNFSEFIQAFNGDGKDFKQDFKQTVIGQTVQKQTSDFARQIRETKERLAERQA